MARARDSMFCQADSQDLRDEHDSRTDLSISWLIACWIGRLAWVLG